MYLWVVLAFFAAIGVCFYLDNEDAKKRQEKKQQLNPSFKEFLDETGRGLVLNVEESKTDIYHKKYQEAQNKKRFEEIRSMIDTIVKFYKKDHYIHTAWDLCADNAFFRYKNLIRRVHVDRFFRIKFVDLHWKGKTYKFGVYTEESWCGVTDHEKIVREYDIVEVSTEHGSVCQYLWGETKKVSPAFIESGSTYHAVCDEWDLHHTELLNRSYVILKAVTLLLSAEFDKQKAEKNIAKQKEALAIDERIVA